MGKLIRLGATALSMIGILVMILCVQAAILFVRLCIRCLLYTSPSPRDS